jgi:apolipoprotein N-acyltransferase
MVTGVYGVSFLVAWFAAGLTCVGLGLARAPSPRSAGLADLALPLLALAFVFAWGLQTVRSAPAPERQLRVAVIQPSIPQTAIWDPSEDQARFADVLRLSEAALAEHPDLLLWPEAAVPGLLRWDESTHAAITGLARSNAVWMIIGADDAIPGVPPDEEVRYFNSSWLIGPNGSIRATYRKQQLVAFGEEVPFTHWLPFLKWFTPITGAFTRGTNFVPFHLDNLNAETCTLICFEDVFPHLVRHGVGVDTDFLVNLTNDGWFREGAAQRQQAASAVFRAVENGVPLVRCTNNGLTCWIDERGRIRQGLGWPDGNLHAAGFLSVRLPLPPAGQAWQETIYLRHGDWFGWLCTALAVVKLATRFRRRRGLPPAIRGATVPPSP